MPNLDDGIVEIPTPHSESPSDDLGAIGESLAAAVESTTSEGRARMEVISAKGVGRKKRSTSTPREPDPPVLVYTVEDLTPVMHMTSKLVTDSFSLRPISVTDSRNLARVWLPILNKYTNAAMEKWGLEFNAIVVTGVMFGTRFMEANSETNDQIGDEYNRGG